MANTDGQRTQKAGLPLGGLLIVPILEVVGRKVVTALTQIGGLFYLLWDSAVWVWRGFTEKKVRIGKAAVVSQIVRVGVRSIFIVSLVSGVVGLILALQLAPPLDEFGQRPMIANIIGVAVLRELGPLIGAIVLTGFAGASIAAEIARDTDSSCDDNPSRSAASASAIRRRFGTSICV